MITYTWTIAQLESQTKTGGVITAHWRAIAEWNDPGVEVAYSASSYGTVGFTPDAESDTFKPYAELTESDVLDWVWNSVDKDIVEASLSDQITVQLNPPTMTGLPWA